MTHPFGYDAAPYVLGALSPDERREFDEHLAGCSACQAEVREFAGLPGLLSRLPADEVAAALEGDASPPRTLLPALQLAVRRQRRTRRWRMVVAGLAAAGLIAVGTGLAVHQLGVRSPAATATALAFRPLLDIPVSATASLVAQPWGTAIDMRCTYSGSPWPDARPRQYALEALDRAGGSQVIGSWTVLVGQEVEVRASTAIPRDRLSRLTILSPSGSALLRLDL